MIEYIKEYGITNEQYVKIIHSLDLSIIENLALSEVNTREVLSYYNEIGVKEMLYNVFLERIDLILLPLETLKKLFHNFDNSIVVKIINSNIKDLSVIGI